MQALFLATLLTLAAIPPLTEEQRAQLDTATDDDKQVDQAALYPLLQNALEWKPGDETGATVPDWKAFGAPADARGRLYLIEGRFFRSRPLKDGLAREGAWSGDKLQEWSIMLEDGKRSIIVLYVVNGPRIEDLPRVNQNIRAAARFYKVWVDKDADGKETRYPVFVGNSARTLGRPDAAPIVMPNFLHVIVFVLAVAFLVVTLWRFLSGRERSRQAQRALEKFEATQPVEEETPADPNAPPLPNDPIAAMEELERRRKAKEEGKA